MSREQRANLKFLAKLGKILFESFAMLQQVSGKKRCHVHVHLNGTRGSKRDGRRLGIVHFDFLPQGQIVNQYVCKEIVRHLMRSLRDKRRDLWENNAWVLHHDNAPAHSALSI